MPHDFADLKDKMMGHRMMKGEFGGFVERSGVDVSAERRFWIEALTDTDTARAL